jgi:hypothetical protein
VGKGKRADVYLEVRKRRGGIYFLNETSACARISGSEYNYMYVYDIWDTM